MNKKIAVFGLGYVGLSNAILLSKTNEVLGIDVNENIVNDINNKKSPIKDEYIERYLQQERLNLRASVNYEYFMPTADYALLCVPTNFDIKTNYFDTTILESLIEKIYNINKNCTIIIKSTIPISFSTTISKKYKNIRLIFSPEFLREGFALYDNLYPSRIVIGIDSSKTYSNNLAENYLNLVLENCLLPNVPSFIVDFTEAECVKLFSNTYLAMRVAFFNELDSFAHQLHLSSKNIIEPVCADSRIGNKYNNPSFGYGGYCLPKDTKQLYSEFLKNNIDCNLIKSVIKSNESRKKYIIDYILNITNADDTIGIFRLIMKSNSDNCRSSSLTDILHSLSKSRKIILYEPSLKTINNKNVILTNDLLCFKNNSSIILANRYDSILEDVKSKLFTRDIFNIN